MENSVVQFLAFMLKQGVATRTIVNGLREHGFTITSRQSERGVRNIRIQHGTPSGYTVLNHPKREWLISLSESKFGIADIK